MKKIIIAILIILLLAGLVWAGIFYWQNLRGVGPAVLPPVEDITDLIPSQPGPGQNQTNLPLQIPAGFHLSILAKNLSGVRVLALDPYGNLWVSRPSAGVVTSLEVRDGKVVASQDIFRGLNKPHGLVFDPQSPFTLYIAEEDKISRTTVYSDAPLEKIADLPTGGRHTTRTLLFGSDNRLYVSIGSSCDVCNESDPRRAAVYVLNKDGSDFQPYATGLRNAVFLTLNPWTQQIWTTEMGRDYLGDNLPPDEINILQAGGNYGWPTCYGKNIHDTDFDQNVYIRAPCSEPFEIPSYIDLPAHSAPLGLAFFPETWPKEYQNDLLVAYHGSWNRTEPTGYKIVRLDFDASGNYVGSKDFVSGWLTKSGSALGRPVDILIQDNGLIYISDDKAGVVYRLEYRGKKDISDKADLIQVDNLKAGDLVASPLTVTGQARGTWYFEASFPVKLLDANSEVIAVVPAQAQSDWMTTEFVPFKAELTFSPPATKTGFLVLEKDNPSGLLQNADELRLEIKYTD